MLSTKTNRTHTFPRRTIRFVWSLALFGTSSFATLSGTVRLPTGQGLAGVSVSLRSAPERSTFTDAQGEWSLAGGVGVLSPRAVRTAEPSTGLVVHDGRPMVAFDGWTVSGRRASSEGWTGLEKAGAARALVVVDTLVFSRSGSVRATLPVGTLDSSGIATVLDTSSACVATPPPAVGTYYASPTGTGTACTLASPCGLATAVKKPRPGETVYLRGGSYAISYFTLANSGSADSGWVTVAAYPCELPIIEGGGVGVSGSYVRVDGLVSRNAASGFGNKWTGAGTTSSNGHVEFLHCIADGNSRNGIAFNSAVGVHIKQCVVAHNGHSTTASWSSGVNIYGAQGTWKDNVVESNVAFENVDMQHHSDGSGFIVDDIGTGTTFVNNIGFRNGGSCIRLTTSTNTHLVNNTCYHDGLDSLAGSDPQYTQPKSPGEILFSSPETRTGVVMLNNLAAASGWNGSQTAYVNTGTLAVAPWNLGVDKDGPTPFFTDPDGDHPDFRPTAAASTVIGAGSATEAPETDIGFDPKCLTKAPPALQGGSSWWIYSIDYDYIKGIGGVARCFDPKVRTGAPDLGAYAR